MVTYLNYMMRKVKTCLQFSTRDPGLQCQSSGVQDSKGKSVYFSMQVEIVGNIWRKPVLIHVSTASETLMASVN